MMLASTQGHSSIVELLLKEGAEFNNSDEVGCPVVVFSSITQSARPTQKGETPLLKAAAKGHSYITDLLIKAGVNVNSKDTGVSRDLSSSDQPMTGLLTSCSPVLRATLRLSGLASTGTLRSLIR
jgi:ankyrin repeat protein